MSWRSSHGIKAVQALRQANLTATADEEKKGYGRSSRCRYAQHDTCICSEQGAGKHMQDVHSHCISSKGRWSQAVEKDAACKWHDTASLTAKLTLTDAEALTSPDAEPRRRSGAARDCPGQLPARLVARRKGAHDD